jgi:arginine decarboxylase
MSYFFATFEEVYEDLLTAAASRGGGNFEEACNDALQFKKEAESAFTLGLMSIGEFAYAEELFDKIMSRVLELKKYDIKGEGSLEAAKLSQAIPCFANLSIFRSAIDSWAIDQSFPIVPVSGLHEKPNNVAKLYDLTCDSDGEIKNFVTSKGSLSPVLPVRCDGSGSFRFALFLLGAYQQSMGNYHNLFGRTCEATVTFPDCSSNQKKNEEGRIKVARLNPAETTAEILRNASYSPESMRAQISQALERQPSQYNSSEETSLLLAALDDFVESSSYLED